MIPTPDSGELVTLSRGGSVLLVIGAAAAVAIFARSGIVNDANFDAAFDEIGREFKVPPNMLRAIAHTESRMNPKAVGENKDKVGKVISRDHGLMQLNDRTLRVYGLTTADAYEPRKAIRVAARLLSDVRNELLRAGKFSSFAWAGAYNVGSDLQPADKAASYASTVMGRWMLYDLAAGKNA